MGRQLHCVSATRTKDAHQHYQSYLEQVLMLDARIFLHDEEKRQQISRFFNDANDDENIIYLLRDHNTYVGYIFIKIALVTVDHKNDTNKTKKVVFQPASALLPEYMGNNILAKYGSRACQDILTLYKNTPVYLTGFAINPGAYRIISIMLKHTYPSPNYQDKKCPEAKVLQKACERWQLDQVRQTSSAGNDIYLIRDVRPQLTLRFQPKVAEDFFFLAYNPDYKQGVYLGFCVQVTRFKLYSGLIRYGIGQMVKLFKRKIPILTPPVSTSEK